MNWQVKYALEYFKNNQKVISTSHIQEDCIKIIAHNMPDITALISSAYEITLELVKHYHEIYPDIDFICGYRKDCIWHGTAIHYLEEQQIGWGGAGTLYTAIGKDNVNIAAHKDFFFSYRLINQMKSINNIVREFDRVFTITLRYNRKLRIGMLQEYEPTADSIRSFWDKFGPVDIIWSINPNSEPTQNAIEAGRELGCKVIQWAELKALITNP